MRRTITFLVAAVIISAIPDTLGAQKKRRQQRDINSVRTEQRDTKREIAETSKKITANTRETSRQLARLNTLSGEIATTTREIRHAWKPCARLTPRLSGAHRGATAP